MPTFCRHSRLVQNCPICSKEQDVEMRPVVSPGGHTVRPARHAGSAGATSSRSSGSTRSGSGRASGGLTVRRLSRSAEDGFRSALVPGLRSGADAQRLAEELAFAATRLERLAADPPGLYAEVADASRAIEERSWLAFLIAYLSPTDDDAALRGHRPGAHVVGVGRTASPRGRRHRAADRLRAGAGPADDRRLPRLGPARRVPGGRVHRGCRVDARAALRPRLRATGASGPASRRSL